MNRWGGQDITGGVHQNFSQSTRPLALIGKLLLGHSGLNILMKRKPRVQAGEWTTTSGAARRALPAWAPRGVHFRHGRAACGQRGSKLGEAGGQPWACRVHPLHTNGQPRVEKGIEVSGEEAGGGRTVPEIGRAHV